MSTSEDIPRQRCNVCKQDLPATTEFFHRDKNKKNGLYGHCKECRKVIGKEYRSRPGQRERVRDYLRAHRSNLEVRTRLNAYNRERYKRPHVHERIRASAKKHSSQPNFKLRRQAWQKSYYSRPEIQERRRERERAWRSRPEIRERRHVWERAYRKRPDVWANRPEGQAHKRAYFLMYDRRPDVLVHKHAYRKHYWARPENRARQNAHYHTRRARKLAAGGKHTVQDVKMQLTRQKGRCYWCGQKLLKYHVDHVIPLARGGSNGPDNLVIACPTCNLKRGAKLPHEFFEGGRLL